MISIPKGVRDREIKRRTPYLQEQKNRRCTAKDGELADSVYEAYLIIFRDLGIELAESDNLHGEHAFLFGSPAGATMVVSSNRSREGKVRACAHALGHLLFEHGQGKEWFTLQDAPPEGALDAQDIRFNADADAMAKALLEAGAVPTPMKFAAIRWILRAGSSKAKVRAVVQRLRELHHAAETHAPGINAVIKSVPGAHSLWESGRAYLVDEVHVSTLPECRE